MWQEFIKFLGILLYENLNLKEHVKYIENKISKNLALLKEARLILEKKCSASSLLLTYTYLLQLCQHNLGRCPQDKFEKSQQSTKTCNMFILNKDKYIQMREILKEHRTLNIYMMNILSNIIFMHRLDNTFSSPTSVID